MALLVGSKLRPKILKASRGSPPSQAQLEIGCHLGAISRLGHSLSLGTTKIGGPRPAQSVLGLLKASHHPTMDGRLEKWSRDMV